MISELALRQQRLAAKALELVNPRFLNRPLDFTLNKVDLMDEYDGIQQPSIAACGFIIYLGAIIAARDSNGPGMSIEREVKETIADLKGYYFAQTMYSDEISCDRSPG